MKVDIREVHALDSRGEIMMGNLEEAYLEVPSLDSLEEAYLVKHGLDSLEEAFLVEHDLGSLEVRHSLIEEDSQVEDRRTYLVI